MVSIKLILAMVIAAVMAWISIKLYPPMPPRRPIEVGKTMAMARMRRLGVEGDWHDYINPGLRGYISLAA